MSADKKSVRPASGGGPSKREEPSRMISARDTEDRLRESEEKYRLLVETTGTGYVILDELGKVVDANGEYARITGRRNPAEVIGHYVLEWTAPYDRERNAAEVRKCISQGFIRNLEIDYITADGRVVPVEINASVLKTGEAVRILTLCRDISERKPAEHKLRQSEERLRLLTENMADAISQLDANRMIVYASPSVEWVFGVMPEDLVGHNAYERVHPEETVTLRKGALQAIERHIPFIQAEYRYRHGLGYYIWVESTIRFLYDEQGEYFGSVISSRDVTKRKQAEETVRESQKRLALALQGGDLGTWDWNVPTGAVRFDERWAQMLGYRVQELGPDVRTWEALVHPEDLPYVQEVLQAHLEGQTAFYETEHRLRHKSGDWVWVLDKGKVIERDTAGKPLRAAGTHLDITERKHGEAALQDSLSLLQATLESTADGILAVDHAGKITGYNQRFAQLWGLPKEVLDTHADEKALAHILPALQDPAGFLEKVQQLYTRPEADSYDVIEFADGRVFERHSRPQLSDGRPVGRVWSFRDITDRRRAEQTLEMFRFTVEQASDGVQWLNRGAGFDYVNEQACRMLGYSREEYMRLHLSDIDPLFPLERWASDWERFQEGRRGGTVIVESIQKHKDGTLIPVEVRAQHLWFGDRELHVAVVRDITERKRTEILLNARAELADRERLNTLDDLLQLALDRAEELTGSSIGFFHLVDPDQQNLTLQTWSTNTLKSMCTAEGKSRHYPVAEAGVWADCLRTRTPTIHNDYAGLKHKKGLPTGHAPVVREAVVPIIRNGLVTCLMGVGNKPTEYTSEDLRFLGDLAAVVADHVIRHRAEAALRESEERFAVFMAHLPAAAFIKDARGQTVFANRYLQELFQFQEWEGKSTTELIPGEVAERMVEDDRRALEGLVEVQENIVDAQGRPRVFQTWKFPVRLPGGPVMLGGISVDITERKQAEEALRSTIAEKEALLREVHHRVKNNLQIVSSLLHLQFRKMKNDEMRSVLQDAENRVRSMALLHEILYRSGELARIRFPEYVKSLCVHLARTQGSEGRRVRLRTAIAEEALDLDQAVTAGLIINELVSNAFKHAFPSAAGGEVRVELEAVDRNRLRLRVADDGRGIPEGITPQDSRTLGLLLVENLSRQLGGTLSVRGRPGTVIEVVFPKTNVQRT